MVDDEVQASTNNVNQPVAATVTEGASGNKEVQIIHRFCVFTTQSVFFLHAILY